MTSGIRLAQAIKLWPVARLRFDRKPARVHSLEQLEQLAASIREFGFVVPILVRRDQVVVSGRARLEAARLLGLERVPVLVVDHLSDQQAAALAIADNRLAELATWDLEILAAELAELTAAGAELESLGYRPEELEGLADQVAGAAADLLELEDGRP